MSEVYDTEPEVIEVKFSTQSQYQPFYVVGKTFDEALILFKSAFTGSQKEANPKAKRHRRTNQEIAADNAKEGKPKTAEEVLADKPKRGRKPKSLWPDNGAKQETVAATVAA